ncbi:MAG: sigma-70 family RNA polymerase sigma factor [Actinobacteria bacterium]|nr:sigma-70 family RNA polymerase sigma factor [Actinomycetota bacterium]MDI6832107.1 sigma-70 family RNA polymerase sigma factor [Actinomycetota bacterium]
MKLKGLNDRDADLFRRVIEDDDPEAVRSLFDRYQDLLHRFAHKYHSDRLPYEDAYQLAALGMMKALRRFDPSRGVSFITFAYPTIEGELRKHYRDHLELIRMPRPLRDLRHRINAESRRYLEEEGHEPDIATLAQRLEVAEEEIIEVLAASANTSVFSLDSSCGDGQEDAPLGFFVGSHDPAFEEVEKELVIDEAMAKLPPRHRRVMYLKLKKSWTQTRIARELGVSQMHVSRLIREAVGMLQERCALQEETA